MIDVISALNFCQKGRLSSFAGDIGGLPSRVFANQTGFFKKSRVSIFPETRKKIKDLMGGGGIEIKKIFQIYGFFICI
ncbi:MAG: hypothetical protein ACYTBZ_18095 [Planctomycetota bacterium]